MSKKEKKVVKDVKKFTVVRKDWYRGKGTDKSCLANSANKLCCLGFYAEACGLDRKTIRNLPSPEEAVRATKGKHVNTIYDKSVTRESGVVWETELTACYYRSDDDCNTSLCSDLMNINDDQELKEEEREKQLKEKFKEIGIKVIFE